MSHPIATQDLFKHFPAARKGESPTRALDGVTLSIPKGAFYGLLGRNGEGKSTLMRCLLGLVHPTSGTASLLGRNYAELGQVERARVAYVPQRDQLAGSLSLREYCTYYRHLFPQWDQPYAEMLIGRFGLNPDRAIRTLSGGIQRKAAILLALASRAEVLLLDEPAAGLDPVARRELIAELIDVMSTADGITVLFSTHILTDLEHLADHCGILHRGQMLLSAPVDELRERYGRLQIICTTEHEASQIQILSALRFERLGRVINALVEQPELVREGLLNEAPEVSVSIFPLSLEELFIELMEAMAAPAPVALREVA